MTEPKQKETKPDPEKAVPSSSPEKELTQEDLDAVAGGLIAQATFGGTDDTRLP